MYLKDNLLFQNGQFPIFRYYTKCENLIIKSLSLTAKYNRQIQVYKKNVMKPIFQQTTKLYIISIHSSLNAWISLLLPTAKAVWLLVYWYSSLKIYNPLFFCFFIYIGWFIKGTDYGAGENPSSYRFCFRHKCTREIH